MIKHHFKIAFRNLLKFKVQSIIGILGMTIGIVAFSFGYQWYKYETSFDGFHPNSDRLYFVSGIEKQTGKRQHELPLALLEVLKTEFPEVENATALYTRFGASYKWGEKKLGYPEMEFVDDFFFDNFVPKVVCGKEEVLKQNDEIAVTRSFAQKFWDSPEAALGNILEWAYGENYTITSVIEDFPENSILHRVELWQPDHFNRKFAQYTDPALKWNQQQIRIFICLKKTVNANDFNKKLKNYLIDNKYNEEMTLDIVPVTSIRHTLGEHFSISGVFSINYIYIFLITTLILLLCVLVNYTNLYISNIYGRDREMRLRHAVGAGKKELLFQAIAELCVQFLLIFLLSCCFIELFMPVFSNILNVEIDKKALWVNFIVVTLVGFVLVSLIQIPLFLYFIRSAALQTSAAGKRAHRSSMVRKTLMVFQVGICVVFLFSALGTGKQIVYLSNKDLGFDKDGLIFFIMSNTERKATVEEIEKIATVEQLSSGGFMYTNDPQTTNVVEWIGKAKDFKPNFQIIDCDLEFFPTMKLELIEGREFEERDWSSRMGDEGMIGIINEEAARIMGKDNIIGEKIQVFNGAIDRDGTYLTSETEIIGVIKDFQTTGFRNSALPLIMLLRSDHYEGYCYYARVTPGNEKLAIQKIEEAFKKHTNSLDPVPEISTMNEIFERLNKSENASFQLFCVLAILSVLISLFGIYSISESNIYRRRKEIAVHKIMGGTTRDVTTMLLREYVGISLISNLICIPVAWFFVDKWLQQFPYRTGIGLIEIAIIILLVTAFIVITVLGHILKASSENPAEIVKSE